MQEGAERNARDVDLIEGNWGNEEWAQRNDVRPERGECRKSKNAKWGRRWSGWRIIRFAVSTGGD